MNEEEITERIKDLIHTCDFGIQQHGTYDDLFELDKTALEGILDLYNKEKEKNNNLIKQLQEQNTEIQDVSRQLRQEKEKNTELRIQISAEEQVCEDLQGKLDLAKTQLDKLNKILFDKDKKISALKELLKEV